MIERLVNYPGYLIRFPSRTDSKKAILLLHGFPANKNVKNLDLAYWLHASLDATLYLLHYRGLGESPGNFKFTDALNEAVEVVDFIRNDQGQTLSGVVGHSWGGLTAMHVAKERGQFFEKLVLVSPLSAIEENDPLANWIIRDVRTECPGVYGNLSEADIKQDLATISEKYQPRELVKMIPATVEVTLIQSSQDETTPAVKAKALLEFFRRAPTYLELDLDHSFSQNRELLSRKIMACFK